MHACKLSNVACVFIVQVNTRFAIDLIREDPVVICTHRVVSSDSGGALGHPKVYINLVCAATAPHFILLNVTYCDL